MLASYYQRREQRILHVYIAVCVFISTADVTKMPNTADWFGVVASLWFLPQYNIPQASDWREDAECCVEMQMQFSDCWTEHSCCSHCTQFLYSQSSVDSCNASAVVMSLCVCSTAVSRFISSLSSLLLWTLQNITVTSALWSEHCIGMRPVWDYSRSLERFCLSLHSNMQVIDKTNIQSLNFDPKSSITTTTTVLWPFVRD